jgi:hypothetical protein
MPQDAFLALSAAVLLPAARTRLQASYCVIRDAVGACVSLEAALLSMLFALDVPSYSSPQFIETSWTAL